MARPKGHPKSGGRKKGTPNKATLIRRQELAAGGELPLDHMLRIMRDTTVDYARRDAMAKAAAPYCHPHLTSVAMTDPSGQGPATLKVQVEFVRAKDGRPDLDSGVGRSLSDLPANLDDKIVPLRKL
jgi:hypothetical protein